MLFITSQALAFSAGCKMTMKDHGMMSSMHTKSIDVNNPHAGHHMQSMEQKTEIQNGMDNCCDQDCQCTQNICSASNSILNCVNQTGFNDHKPLLLVKQEHLIKSLIFSALFRPPIIC